MNVLRYALALAIGSAIAWPAFASAPSPAARGVAPPPPAFLAFCNSFPDQCVVRAAAGPLRITAQRAAELRQVNVSVNRSIRQASDRDLYGRADFWTLPLGGAGDCEDIALLKRKKLLDLGWPSSALLIAVVRDRRGEGHAVLVVATADGDIVLDNRTSTIRSRSESPYTFYAMQSSANPRQWTALTPGATAVGTASAQRGGMLAFGPFRPGRPSLR